MFNPIVRILSYPTILAAAFLIGCSAPPEVALFDEAERKLGEGSYAAAVDAYSRVVLAYPESEYAAPSLYRKGFIYDRHMGEPVKAIEAYASIFFLYPESGEVVMARRERASIFSRLGDHLNSIEEYGWLMEKGPAREKDGFHFKIAMEYVKMNDFGQARVEMEELLSASPGTPLAPEVRLQIANSLYLEGFLTEAALSYGEVADEYMEKPQALEARLARAVVLEEMGSHREALVILKALEKDYPNKGVIRIRIASTEERLKDGPRSKKKKSKKR